jgi:hypothetical protein
VQHLNCANCGRSTIRYRWRSAAIDFCDGCAHTFFESGEFTRLRRWGSAADPLLPLPVEKDFDSRLDPRESNKLSTCPRCNTEWEYGVIARVPVYRCTGCSSLCLSAASFLGLTPVDEAFETMESARLSEAASRVELRLLFAREIRSVI